MTPHARAAGILATCAALGLTSLFGLFGLSACARSSISAESRADGGAPIDTDVMAYLSEARALHHEANLKEDAGDLEGAITALDQLVRSPAPRVGDRVPPEVDEVLADTFARMAELRLRAKDLTGAEADARLGLEHAPGPTYFRGHLLEVSGIVEESRAAALADAGEPAKAKDARKRALDLLDQAVKLQDAVVRRSLAGPHADGAAP